MRFLFYASAVVFSLDAVQLAEAGLFYRFGIQDLIFAATLILMGELGAEA